MLQLSEGCRIIRSKMDRIIRFPQFFTPSMKNRKRTQCCSSQKVVGLSKINWIGLSGCQNIRAPLAADYPIILRATAIFWRGVFIPLLLPQARHHDPKRSHHHCCKLQAQGSPSPTTQTPCSSRNQGRRPRSTLPPKRFDFPLYS